MFPARYFPARYFAARYWPQVGADVAFVARAGTFAADTTGTAPYDQTITLSGFNATPKAMLFWLTPQTSAGVAAGVQLGFGAAVSASSEAAVAVSSEDAQTDSDSDRRHTNVRCITLLDFTQTVVAAAELKSFNSGQAVITWQTKPGAAYVINYLAIGGTDVEASLLTTPTTALSTGNTNYAHGLSAAPTALVAFGTADGAAQINTRENATVHIGIWADGTSRVASMAARDALTDSDTLRVAGASFLRQAWTSELFAATVNSVDATNVTLNYTTAGAGQYFYLLCLTGCSADVAAVTTPTASGSKSVTGVGFTPTAIFNIGCMATAASGVQQGGRLAIGADDATSAVSAGIMDEDAQATTDGDRVQDSDDSIIVYDHAQTLKAAGKVSSFNSDGFDLTFGTFDGSNAYEFSYLALGEQVAAAGTILPFMMHLGA